MGGFVRGDILVTGFPFSNLQNSKKRPILVLRVPKGNDLICLQITGNSYDKSSEISIENFDFKKGSLNRKSFARLDKIATLEKSIILYKIGSLKKEKFLEILDKFIAYMK